MRGRQPIPLVLKPKEVTTLQALLSQGSLPQRVAHRARILLARTQGHSVDQVTVKVDQDRTTVWAGMPTLSPQRFRGGLV